MTYRIRWENKHWIENKFPHRKTVIFAHWHEDDLSLVAPNKNKGHYILISQSHDGDLLAYTMSKMGYNPVRGSSSRGGARGLINLIRQVKKGGDAILTVDGPRGPRHVVKPGIVTLALKTGAVIVTVSSFARKKWVFKKSWSQTYLPKPFSEVIVSFGRDAIDPPESESEESIEKTRLEVEKALFEAHEQLNRFGK